MKGERYILRETKRRTAICIGHILRRNCLLQRVTEGKKDGGYKRWEDEEEDVSSYWLALRKKRMLEI